MEDVAKAHRYANLGNDPVFRELLRDVRGEQASTFLRPSSSSDEREDAHAVVRALAQLERRIQSAKNTLTVSTHKEKSAP
jgi:hypothetical protein